ncbi:MAG: CotH kinase family protein [Proteobacteria bacterium]|nr:CotH kinase family protein [Pseudomonadota bacterium]
MIKLLYITVLLALHFVACKTTDHASKDSNILSPNLADQGDVCAVIEGSSSNSLAQNLYKEYEIHTVNIIMNEQDWEQLRNEEPKKPCTIDPEFSYTKFPAKVSINGVDLGDFKIKKKSICGSLSTNKPGLNLKKNGKDGQNRLFQETSESIEAFSALTLNNSVQDPSYLRQCQSYQLMRDLKYPAPRCNFAKVCVNKQFKGIYINVEPLDAPFVAKFLGDVKAEGILVEGEWTGNGSGRNSDFYSENPAEVFDVKLSNSKELSKVFAGETHQRFLKALDADPEKLSADDINAIKQVVDLEKYRQFLLLEHLLGQYDGANGNRNNHYLYFNPNSKQWTYLPWGMDQTLKGPPNEPYRALRLAKTYLGSPELRKDLAQDYAKLAKEISEPEFKARSLAMGTKIRKFLPRDQQEKLDKAVENMTWNLWRAVTLDPSALFLP